MQVALLASLILLSSPNSSEDAGTQPSNPQSLVGQPAPRFILRTLNPQVGGTRYLLRDHVGPNARFPKNGILLDFAASWCVPCRAELSRLKSMASTFAAAGIGVAVVVIDNEKEGIDMMRQLTTTELKLPFPVISDRFKVLARRYKIERLPLAIGINSQGIIQYVQEGYTEAFFEKIRTAFTPSNH